MLEIVRAVIITRPGGPEVLEIQEVPAPRPGAHEVLVRVIASALNRADLAQREGRYPAPPGSPENILGLEFAGEVAELGRGASRWRSGQRVFGITGGGGQAEYLVSHESMLAEIPANLSWAEAASVPEAFITAHDALWKQAELVAGESVLIHAVGSGVGLAAAQLAHARGARAYGTSGTAAKLERARKYGLRDAFCMSGDFAALLVKIGEWTDGKGVNVVMDLVGGPYLSANIEALAVKGRLLLVGTVAGRKAELDIGKALQKRLKIIGTALRSRPLEEKIAATEAFAAEVVPLFANGTLRSVIDREFPLQQVQEAHRRVESNENFGKVVLRIAET